MADELKIGYTTLRDWCGERYAMRHEVFQKLVVMCPQCEEFRIFVKDLKEDNWGRRLGRLRTRQRKRGFFDLKYAKQRKLWRSTGGKIGLRKWHTQMKANKPDEYRRIQQQKLKNCLKYKYEYHGQKYRNSLELEVAKVLTDNGAEFEYEPIVKCKGKFYFPDFMIDDAIIECTFWHDIKQRAEELRLKVNDYRKLRVKEIFVVTFPKYVNGYSKLIGNSNVTVITPETLGKMLGGTIGRVERV